MHFNPQEAVRAILAWPKNNANAAQKGWDPASGQAFGNLEDGMGQSVVQSSVRVDNDGSALGKYKIYIHTYMYVLPCAS